MRVLPSPFAEPFPEVTDLEADAKIMREQVGPELEARLRKTRSGEPTTNRPKRKTKEELLEMARKQIEEDNARMAQLAEANKVVAAELYGFTEINEAEAKRLGLEKVFIESEPIAQSLLARIFDQSRPDRFDVANPELEISKSEIGRFVAEWNRLVVDIPAPYNPRFVPSYLVGLATKRIVRNLDPNNKTVSYPEFDKTRVLYVMDWEERDYKDETLKTLRSELLKDLGIAEFGVIKISRNTVDKALWVGDPGDRIKTPQHTEIIQKLNLDPAVYCFRPIAYDEYVRMAKTGKNFGNNGIFTIFNDYLYSVGGNWGLTGGNGETGGLSDIGEQKSDVASETTVVRLVIECNK